MPTDRAVISGIIEPARDVRLIRLAGPERLVGVRRESLRLSLRFHDSSLEGAVWNLQVIIAWYQDLQEMRETCQLISPRPDYRLSSASPT